VKQAKNILIQADVVAGSDSHLGRTQTSVGAVRELPLPVVAYPLEYRCKSGLSLAQPRSTLVFFCWFC
jgi:hypothetical protein